MMSSWLLSIAWLGLGICALIMSWTVEGTERTQFVLTGTALVAVAYLGFIKQEKG